MNRKISAFGALSIALLSIVVVLFQNCSKVEFAKGKTGLNSTGLLCLYGGQEYQEGQIAVEETKDLTRVGTCTGQIVTYDLQLSRQCHNGNMEEMGAAQEVNLRYSGLCSCDGVAHGGTRQQTAIDAFTHSLECSQKVETCDVLTTQSCNNGSWVNQSSQNTNCATTGSCPVSCAGHSDGSQWTVHTDDYRSEADASCSFGGKTKYFDLNVTYQCTSGSASEIQRQEVLDRTTGNCNCDGAIHGATKTENYSQSCTPSCSGKSCIDQKVKTYTCSNGSLSLTSDQLISHNESGWCSCSGHPHGTQWTEITQSGASETYRCAGQLLVYDLQQTKQCNDGSTANIGSSQKINQSHQGECHQICNFENYPSDINNPAAQYLGWSISGSHNCALPGDAQNVRATAEILFDDGGRIYLNGQQSYYEDPNANPGNNFPVSVDATGAIKPDDNIIQIESLNGTHPTSGEPWWITTYRLIIDCNYNLP